MQNRSGQRLHRSVNLRYYFKKKLKGYFIMENNLLLAAKTEYTGQLQEILCKYIYEGINFIWVSLKTPETKNVLRTFQERLCLIPKWNQDIINKEYDRITQDISKDYIDKLIEAIFLSNVKILSVVKLNDKSKTIQVSVPDTKHFIHKCYIEAARGFYTDPFLIDDREDHLSPGEINRNIRRSLKVISEAIEKTIRKMIPMEDILNKYLRETEEYFNTIDVPEPDPEPEVSDHDSEPEPEPEVEDPSPETETEANSYKPTDLFMEETKPVEDLPLPQDPYRPHVDESLNIKLNNPENLDTSEKDDGNFFSDGDGDDGDDN